jgi:glycosyltransferase involved in cell wall biosynthesis
MLNHLQIRHIPHGVDTDVYRPLDKDFSRSVLGIPAGKKVLLFMARRMDPSHKTGHMKGTDLLARAIQEMPITLRRQTIMLLVGEGGDAFAREIDMEAVSLGFVSSDRLKAIVYSAADVFVFPSRAENLPLVLIESMACGTPMVSFKVGGVPDLVRPGVTGLLAEPENPKQLAAHFVELLEDVDLRTRLSRQCRTIAMEEYPLSLYIDRHVALYRRTVTSFAT